jgi:hypothetical protein
VSLIVCIPKLFPSLCPSPFLSSPPPGAPLCRREPAETLAQDVPTLIQSFENTTQRLGDTKAK